MRRTILFTVWLLVPIALLAYHFGPGQARLGAERAAKKIAEARQLEAAEQWTDAAQAWAEALADTPAARTTQRLQIQLAQANARIYAGELPEAMDQMEKLLTEAQTGKADAGVQREIRSSLASSRYYAAWLMRLEGAPPRNGCSRPRARANISGCWPRKPRARPWPAVTRKTSKPRCGWNGWICPSCKACRSPRNAPPARMFARSAASSRRASARIRARKRSPKDARGAGFNDVPKGGS